MLTINGRVRKAAAEPNKAGWVYILDRTNGKPLIGIDEMPVPQIRKWEHDFLDYLDASHPKILSDIKTKKALDDDLTNRLKAAITAFRSLTSVK